MSTMKHRGYHARVVFDDRDGIFVGHIAGINDIVGFHADTVADLRAAFHDAVDDYIDTCTAIGKEPEKAYSGKVMLRLKPSVHAAAALAAELRGVSLNAFAEEALRSAGAANLERAGAEEAEMAG